MDFVGGWEPRVFHPSRTDHQELISGPREKRDPGPRFLRTGVFLDLPAGLGWGNDHIRLVATPPECRPNLSGYIRRLVHASAVPISGNVVEDLCISRPGVDGGYPYGIWAQFFP